MDIDKLLADIRRLERENKILKDILEKNNIKYDLTVKSDSFSRNEKIDTYMAYFRGRTDVFAERFIKNGKKGYAVVCENKFKPCCDIKNTKCKNCHSFSPTLFNREKCVEHLKYNPIEKYNKAYGIYPIVDLNKCYFLAIDFDKDNFKDAALAYKKECISLNLDPIIELSQSGKGAHVWLFFADLVKASDARLLGDYILTNAIASNSNISFKSYDRFFPNQDYVGNNQYGNLIALPLEGNSVKLNETSLFVDDDFIPFSDQILALSRVKKISTTLLESIVENIKEEKNELEINSKSFKKISLRSKDFPNQLEIILANEIYISKNELSSKALSFIKRFGVIHNPDFYEKQAKRLSTYNISRIIELYNETDKSIILPRGILDDLKETLDYFKIKYNIIDNRTKLKSIRINFNATLRLEQEEAVNETLKYDNGLLVAPTGSGKTIMGLKMIEMIHKPTIILVESINLLKQWKERINKFLDIYYDNLKIEPGIYYGSKKKLTGILDIVSIKSIADIDIYNNYELMIFDEVHHAASKEYEKTIRKFNVRYSYGLTATPKRSDKLEKIVYKSIGKIRYEMKHRKDIEFTKTLIPITTKYRYDLVDGERINYQDVCNDMVNDNKRNMLIVENVINEFNNQRNILILTKRVEHIIVLEKMLEGKVNNIFTISGTASLKEKKIFLEKIKAVNANYIIISTGDYLGEGFDLPSLNTLFVAMPFKWEGINKQYIGRIERSYLLKEDVKIYDFVDVKVGMLQNMFSIRLKQYRKEGYKIINDDESSLIYLDTNYLEKLKDDLEAAENITYLINYARENILEKYLDYFASITVKTNVELSLPNTIKLIKSESKINAIIIDERIVWYGSINPFRYSNTDETILRLDDTEYAKELLK